MSSYTQPPPSGISQKPSKDNAITFNALQADVHQQASRTRHKEASRNQSAIQSTDDKLLTAEELVIVGLLRASRINPTDDLPEPTPCLTVELSGQVSNIGTIGNFSLLIGAAKSRKSFAVCMAIAAALNSQRPVIGCIRGHLPANKAGVLYFDTEQGRCHVARAVRRVCLLSEIENPQHLQTFALRSLDTLQRLEAIRYAIEHTPGIGLVVIDGIRDTVFDINSPEEATATATLLLRLTEQYEFHLLTVLHTNKGMNTDARGHLGTELQNKAETVIRVSKDPNDKSISIVAPDMCRDRDFEPFAFTINEQGLPIMANDWQPTIPKVTQRNQGETAKGEGKYAEKRLTSEQLTLVLKRAFAGEPKTYDGTWRNLIEATQYHGFPVPSQNDAKQLLTTCTQQGYVENVKGKDRYPAYRSTGHYPSE